jgi:hypothetical protein
MFAATLLQLIQAHAGPLTKEAMDDLRTNPRTSALRRIRAADLETRVSALYYNLGKWLGDPRDDAVRQEYEDMGRTRFHEGVPLSELIYAVILTKKHLRRYIRDHGLVDFAGDRITPDELVGATLHSIQELNYQVGEFFDRALYYLATGYESEASSHRRAG